MFTKLKYLAGIILLFLFSFSIAQHVNHTHSFENLKQLLPGVWKNTQTNTFEQWWIVNDSVIAGAAFSFNNKGEADLIETLRIVFQRNKVFYEATVSNQNFALPIDFELIGKEYECFEFANQDHDFPQIIQYCFEGNSMNATISNTEKSKKIKFEFEKTESKGILKLD